MATIAPFRGVTYDPAKLGVALSEVVAEPYDKIDEPLRQKYLARHAKNCVRLILAKDEDPVEEPSLAKHKAYPRARVLMDRWLEQGLLSRAKKPAVYVLEQRYELDGREHVRVGLIARVAVDGDDVKFHERTFAGPKSDRRSLLDATDADFDQVFFLADDEDGRLRDKLAGLVDRAKGLVATAEAGRQDRLIAVDDVAVVDELARLVKGRDVTIADGHHRFEMTRERWLERKCDGKATDGDRYRTAAIFVTSDPGLTILPTHRLVRLAKDLAPADVVKKLGERLKVTPIDGAPRAAIEAYFRKPIERGRVVLYGPRLDRAYRLELRADHDPAKSLSHVHESVRGLEVAWLHGLALDPIVGEAKHDTGDKIGFQRGVEAGVARLDEGEYDLIFALPATDVRDVIRCGRAGARMPQKSTDFYPKLLSGLVIDDRRG